MTQQNSEKILAFSPKRARKDMFTDKSVNELLDLAKSSIELRDYDMGNAYAQECIRRDAKNLSAQIFFAETVINDRESERKFNEFLTRAVKRMHAESWSSGDENHLLYLLMREEYGRLLMEEGKYTLACRQFECILDTNPTDARNNRYRLASLYAILERRSTLDAFARAYPHEKNSPFFLFPRAVAAFKENDYETTKRLVQHLCRLAPHWQVAFRRDIFVTLTDNMDSYDKKNYRKNSFDEMLAVLECNAILLVTTPGFTDYGINLVVTTKA
ncbi:MAG: hypothetical protein WCR76_10805 [Sphaerochaetaceae bacterium]